MKTDIHSNTVEGQVNPKEKPGKSVFLSRLRRRVLRHVWLVRILLIAVLVAGFYFLFVLVGMGIKKSGIEYYLDLAKVLVSATEADAKAINGRTNILVLGKGGQGHEAADLTDTMMVASISYKEPSVTIISLPRDIWITELRAKLNSAYYWGNEKQEGGGILLVKSTVEKLLDEPVQYAVVLDFSGFKTIIDILGGIEVEVEREFTDENYPIAGRENDLCNGDNEYRCRYEKVSFKKGLQYMDGETALKYVRSRHAEGDEGTDIARSARQQRIIAAIKEKTVSPEVLFSKTKTEALLTALEENIETDIEFKAGAILARSGLEVKDNVHTFTLPEEFLVNPPTSPRYDNLYVFVPRGEDWKEVQNWVNCVFEGKAECSEKI